MTNPLPTPIPNQQPATNNQPPTTNRATGPRTAAGKQRSSQNALTHGLTSSSPVLASEDQAAYDTHRRGFFDEYQPTTPTETQLTQELAETAWRINRIPSLEAALLDRAANPPNDQAQRVRRAPLNEPGTCPRRTPFCASSSEARIDFDIVDAHRALATLGLHYARLSRQFQKAVDKLREIQAERREAQERDLKRATGLQELHKRKGIPYDPSQDGFVFSNQQIEDFAQRRMRLNESHETEYRICHMLTPAQAAAAREKSAASTREKSAAGAV
jgi:hypothetical protein